jgi:phosphate transport system protein
VKLTSSSSSSSKEFDHEDEEESEDEDEKIFMENHFEAGIENLRQKLLVMASHSEKSVNEAVQALMQRDLDLALRVKADDDVIDRYEVEIDELAIQLLTKAPLASNLRLVTVAMKLSQNLERIGDEATKIAKRARDLAQEPPVKLNLDLPNMASLALKMVKDSLDAFVQKDSAAARAIIPRDKEVDALNKELHQRLAQHMTENPDTIARCLHWIVAAKSLERIADHAKNIAEEVVYLCEAQDIRHGQKG